MFLSTAFVDSLIRFSAGLSLLLKLIPVTHSNYLCFVIVSSHITEIFALNMPFYHQCIYKIGGVQEQFPLTFLNGFLYPKIQRKALTGIKTPHTLE